MYMYMMMIYTNYMKYLMFAFTYQDGPIEYLSDLHFALQIVEIDTAKYY